MAESQKELAYGAKDDRAKIFGNEKLLAALRECKDDARHAWFDT